MTVAQKKAAIIELLNGLTAEEVEDIIDTLLYIQVEATEEF